MRTSIAASATLVASSTVVAARARTAPAAGPQKLTAPTITPDPTAPVPRTACATITPWIHQVTPPAGAHLRTSWLGLGLAAGDEDSAGPFTLTLLGLEVRLRPKPKYQSSANSHPQLTGARLRRSTTCASRSTPRARRSLRWPTCTLHAPLRTILHPLCAPLSAGHNRHLLWVIGGLSAACRHRQHHLTPTTL